MGNEELQMFEKLYHLIVTSIPSQASAYPNTRLPQARNHGDITEGFGTIYLFAFSF